jgi:hypothetical protein
MYGVQRNDNGNTKLAKASQEAHEAAIKSEDAVLVLDMDHVRCACAHLAENREAVIGVFRERFDDLHACPEIIGNRTFGQYGNV